MDPLQELQGFDAGHTLALIKKLGGRESAEALLRGEKIAKLEDAPRLLFDKNGRCIPVKPEVTAAVCDATRRIGLEPLPPTFHTNYSWMDEDWQKRWRELFKQGHIYNPLYLGEVFTKIRKQVEDDPMIANLLLGPCYPVILPEITLGKGGYGALLEKLILPAVASSYTKTFPGRHFDDPRGDQLAGRVTIVDELYEKLVKKLFGRGPTMGLLCFPLQGFSIHAQRQMVQLLPNYMSLAGPIEIGVFAAMYPSYMTGHIPEIDCSAIQWNDPWCSFCFVDHGGDGLEFGPTRCIDEASGYHSGGVFIISSGLIKS